jgi:hypothetical protein
MDSYEKFMWVFCNGGGVFFWLRILYRGCVLAQRPCWCGLNVFMFIFRGYLRGAIIGFSDAYCLGGFVRQLVSRSRGCLRVLWRRSIFVLARVFWDFFSGGRIPGFFSGAGGMR